MIGETQERSNAPSALKMQMQSTLNEEGISPVLHTGWPTVAPFPPAAVLVNR